MPINSFFVDFRSKKRNEKINPALVPIVSVNRSDLTFEQFLDYHGKTIEILFNKLKKIDIKGFNLFVNLEFDDFLHLCYKKSGTLKKNYI